MRTVPALAIAFALLVETGGCGRREPADAVLIVDGENVAVRGQVEFVFSPDGGAQPNIWVPGNVVIFRTDGVVAEQAGEAGMAYRIAEDGSLDPEGEVDVARTDDELAAEFGIEKVEDEPPAGN